MGLISNTDGNEVWLQKTDLKTILKINLDEIGTPLKTGFCSQSDCDQEEWSALLFDSGVNRTGSYRTAGLFVE